ncbi:acetylxylan esterase [Paenibacillus radicis (ex Xue et al. 2023)]|uniref:Acetylxylan esterase n=1 Tax=Paenibacillus radicis (ex Xue et al. 2023) TaxID=2972489 RepID=A0ABT1YNM6_9BACL|nr:acetylxylan esterase [Paenibacillus radicis (ex Xue et al. 2023)]MCR8634781.1 acetylxylan esterase [Paenibacillus radicis (ex Xue et al. 2023)]
MKTTYPNAIGKKIKELEQLNPPLTAREDLSSYWEQTLKQFSSKPLNDSRERVLGPQAFVDAYKVSFEGFDDTPIKGWFLLPKFVPQQNLPCVVIYHGYTGGSGYPEDYSQWLLMGIAVFAVDVRGQGGETGNLLPQNYGMTKGWMTQGILDKDTCYYKAITIDSIKAVDWVHAQPEIDSSRIAIVGGSQGGGLVLITAALSDKPALAIANIPNMCYMDHGLLNSTGSLTEAAAFVARYPDKLEQVLETLSYFDILNLGERIRIPAMLSVGLKDTVCLPETVFAAYNRITSEKVIHTYPFTGHDVVAYHNRLMLDFVSEHFSLS